MKTKGKVIKITIAVVVLATMLMGMLPVTAVKTLAEGSSFVKEASTKTLLKREDLLNLEKGKTYKIGNSFQYAIFQDREWLIAGHTKSDFTGEKDGLVLWSRKNVDEINYGKDAFGWWNSELKKYLNDSEEQYLRPCNINTLFTSAAKSLVIPVTLEDYNYRKRSYNNYLYIADVSTSKNGVHLGPYLNELEITFDEFVQINKVDKETKNESWLRSFWGTTDLLSMVQHYYTLCKFNESGSYALQIGDSHWAHIYYALVIPAFVMDLSKVVLATTSPEAASLSDGKHILSAGTMSFRIQNDEKIKSTLEYTNDYLCIKKDPSDGDIYLCVQYATWGGSSNNEEIITKKISEDTIIDAFDLGINTYKYCTLWLETKKDSTDNLVYAKEGEYNPNPVLNYTSYGVTEEFAPYVENSKAIGKVTTPGFAPSFNPDITVEAFDQSGNPTGDNLWAYVNKGELIVSTSNDLGPGSYYLKIRASDGENTKSSDKIPITVSKLKHVKNEKSLSVEAESKGKYSTTLFWPAEGGSYGTPTVEGDIRATNISIDTTGSEKTITFTVPSCKDGSTGKIIIPVTGCTNYYDYNIVINLSANNKSITYWSKMDLEDFGKGNTYYVKSGVLQKASFAGKEWYAIGVEENGHNKKGLVLLSASAICQRVYNPHGNYDADYATSELNDALNSNTPPITSEVCNINQMFTTAERSCLLAVNVDYSVEKEKKTKNNVQLYVPDGDSDISIYRDSVLLGSKNSFSIRTNEWKGSDSGFFWCRSKTGMGEVYAGILGDGVVGLGEADTDNNAGYVVPQIDLDLSKVIFASTAPAAGIDGTSDVIPNATMVFRLDGSNYIKSTLTGEVGNQIFNIGKSDEDKQPLYFCVQYETAEGTKIYTKLITESGSVDISSITNIDTNAIIWIETTSENGGMVYAKKVQPVLSYTPAEEIKPLYSNMENSVTLGTVGVSGYSDSDVVIMVSVFESEAEGAPAITDDSIRAYIQDGILYVNTSSKVTEGTYCVRVSATSQYFTETLIKNITLNVVKRTNIPPVLSIGVNEGTKKYTISRYYLYNGSVLDPSETPKISGDINITDFAITKNYSAFDISFTATEAKAGQTGKIEIPVYDATKEGIKIKIYDIVISVICASNSTWYTPETLKSLGSNGVSYGNGNSLLKASFAGRTWLIAGTENNDNTGNKDTLVMVAKDSVTNSDFNEEEKGANYYESKIYKLLNSSNSAYVNKDGNAHKIFGDAIKYVVPVKIYYSDETGKIATSDGNYLYLADGDYKTANSISMGTTGSYSMPLESFISNIRLEGGITWLRSAGKSSYAKAIKDSWGRRIDEGYYLDGGGHVLPEFNLDLQDVLFASPAFLSKEGEITIDPNSDIVFRFRDSECFDGRVNYNGEGSEVDVILDKTYIYPVFLCVQYKENGTEKLCTIPITESGKIDLSDKVKGDLSTAHIWIEMQNTLNGVVYATLSEKNDHKHTMVFSVSEDGKSLEAWCSTGEGSNCEYSKANKISLTLNAQNYTYASATYEVSISGTERWAKAGFTIPTIYYEGVEGTSYEKTDEPPYNAGTYKAEISAGEDTAKVTASVKFTISKKELSVCATTVDDKTYDGTCLATVNIGSVDGIIDGDDVKVKAEGTFSDKNAEDNIKVTVVYELSGEDAVNYVVPKTETLTADIEKKEIFVSANSDASAKGQALKELTYTSDMLVAGDAFTGQLATYPAERRNDMKGSYAIILGSLSAGDNYTIHFTEGTYTVTEKKVRRIVFEETNEAPVLQTSLFAEDELEEFKALGNIENEPEEKNEEDKTLESEEQKVEEPKILESEEQKVEEPKFMAPMLTNIETPAPAIVNGNITITYGDYETFTHTITDDSIDVTYSSSVDGVATVNASTGEVTIVGAGTTVIKAVAVDLNEEYEDSEASYTLTVLKKHVSVPEAISGLIYDGREQTGVILDSTEGALYTEDTGSVHAALNAGEYTCILKLINSNYIWDTPAPTSKNRNIIWTVGRKRLSVTGSTADKEYDGTIETSVKVGEVTGIVRKDGSQEYDDIQVTAEGEFEHPYADDNREAWIDYSLTGKDKDNYLAPFSEMINAKITPKKLSISGTSVADKVYDGARSAVATCGPLEGLLEGDDVLPLGWAAFTDKNAGNDKEVIVVYTLLGEEAENYEAPDMETLSADITKATINVEAVSSIVYVGSKLLPLDYTYDNLFDGDSFTGELATNANAQKVGKYSITQGTLSAGDNYNINFTNGTYEVEKKLAQNIWFMDIENNKLSKTVGDPDYTNTVYGACSDVVLKSSNENVAVTDGMKVTIVGPGTAVITATAKENEIYAAAEAKYTLTVKQAANPGTGDSNNVLPYIIMMAAALLVIGLVILRGKGVNGDGSC